MNMNDIAAAIEAVTLPEDQTDLVTVTHTFRVHRGLPNDDISNIVANMTVQVEEPVVGYSDELALNEITTTTDDVSAVWNRQPMIPVWVISHVAGITVDDDGITQTSTGGFWWEPIDKEQEVREVFDKEAAAWKGDTARCRLLRVLVPDFSTRFAGTLSEAAQEEVRQEVTRWLDARIEDVEYRWPAIETRWVYEAGEQRRAMLLDLLYLTRRVEDDGQPHRPYRHHPDESAEVKAWFRDMSAKTISDDEKLLLDALIDRFPNEWDEINDEDPPRWEVLAFREQNPKSAAGLDIEDIDAFAQHHAGGLVVLISGPSEHDGYYVKMHDSWGDDGNIVVHVYHPEMEDGEDVVASFNEGEAHKAFLLFTRLP